VPNSCELLDVLALVNLSSTVPWTGSCAFDDPEDKDVSSLSPPGMSRGNPVGLRCFVDFGSEASGGTSLLVLELDDDDEETLGESMVTFGIGGLVVLSLW
jgi:hypothetical protein